MDIRKILLII